MVETAERIMIEVELVGPVRRPWPERKREMALDPEIIVAALLSQLGFSTADSRYLSVLVNGERVTPDASLRQGDRVIVALMVGGG